MDLPSHNEFVANTRQRLVVVCQSMLSGKISFLEGAVEVCSLRDTIEVSADDPDLRAFIVICSETDHLPLANIQHRWSAQALERLRPEIDHAEIWAKSIATEACENLIRRFA